MSERANPPQILVVGLGPGSAEAVPSGTWTALRQERRVVLRTAVHPTVAHLEAAGVAFESLDWVYERSSTFEEAYRTMVHHLLALTREGDLVYAVPGHPCVAEQSVKLLLRQAPAAGVSVRIGAGASALDALFTAAQVDPAAGLEVCDAVRLSSGDQRPSGRFPAFVLQIYDRHLASDIKLTLMERYPDDHPVTLIRAAGIPGQEQIQQLPLFELDRQKTIDHLTSLYVPPLAAGAGEGAAAGSEARYALDPLMQVVLRLRAPDGCPWDREQTHQSLRPYVLEEAFEVAEALDGNDRNKLREELGDLLLQIALHSAIAEESGHFTANDVIAGITAKMVRRHPHVFGTAEAHSSEEVTRRWEEWKQAERAAADQSAEADSALDGVPVALPALQRAYKLGQKAARAGFDWESPAGVWDKLREELDELRAALRQSDAAAVREELGDALFALAQLARLLKVEPEAALGQAVQKFVRRFRHMEQTARRQGLTLNRLTAEQWDQLWCQAKQAFKEDQQ